MSYLGDFDREFMRHTLRILEAYDGEFDATILVNCLLGLLVVPKESFLDAILPEAPLTELPAWGIKPQSIYHPGKAYPGNPNPKTLRGLVISLRHAVAHFRIKPIPHKSDVHSFEYRNDRGLHAVISLAEMREFTKKLARHLERQ
jgi:HEPN pEK499 p136